MTFTTSDPAAATSAAEAMEEEVSFGPAADPNSVGELESRTPAHYAGIFWREWLQPFLLILVVLLSFRSAVADWNHVPTGSMRPNILEGDRIFVNKLAYDLRVPFTTKRMARWGAPARGDIVVFLSPSDEKRLVKRVVALPGDRIELRRHRLFINGRPAMYQRVDQASMSYLEDNERETYRISNESLAGRDSYAVMTKPWFSGRSTFSPITLGDNEFFVMGDNRDDSADSRVFGVVERDLILGEATGIALSMDPKRRYRPRWDRFFQGFGD